MAWQNWYNELHAHKEKSHKLSEQVGGLAEGVKGLEASLNGLFPASVEVENLLGDMEALQVHTNVHFVHVHVHVHVYTCALVHVHVYACYVY